MSDGLGTDEVWPDPLDYTVEEQQRLRARVGNASSPTAAGEARALLAGVDGEIAARLAAQIVSRPDVAGAIGEVAGIYERKHAVVADLIRSSTDALLSLRDEQDAAVLALDSVLFGTGSPVAGAVSESLVRAHGKSKSLSLARHLAGLAADQHGVMLDPLELEALL